MEALPFYKHFSVYIFLTYLSFSSYLIFILKSRNSAVKAAAVKIAKRAVFLFSRLYCIKWVLLQSFSVSAAVFIPAPVQSFSHEGGEGVLHGRTNRFFPLHLFFPAFIVPTFCRAYVYELYSLKLYLPPLSVHCVEGC